MKQEEIVQTYRPLLFSIAYNMLGSVMDAEDCVQETFLRWYSASSDQEAELIHNPKGYLCTVITRLCIDELRQARRQRESYIGVWLPEPMVTDDMSIRMVQNEVLSITLLHLLETLTPLQRAVFLLRQVFDYDYAEIAHMVQKSTVHCRQLMWQARHALRVNSQHDSLEVKQHSLIVNQFLDAYKRGDMEGLLSLFAHDVALYTDGGGKAKAARKPLYGAFKAARFLVAVRPTAPEPLVYRLAHINGRPGIIHYRKEALYSVWAFDIAEQKIREVNVVANPEKLRHIPPPYQVTNM
ncbi:sigma-70 family RNA polymerase sigma factor [Ktedonosporobacter rubrisoli]|uniref:Sigma-70 family RNA polymerase sigma factor n=1 Tax=Ktedonosporobacter rubrisoli TaxID=2509675 RepID=A0A4P6K168_KTERU|nr:RNA polymerase sigma factor SigJ [Ktedonosporobacter rubrisoli]QBD81176.1 sigma-70 family RNA polymerase sigma factor [Ktedonosporobacter rubrisoli]